MRFSKLVGNLLKYLPVLAVLVATVISMLVGKNIYPATINSQSNTPATQLPADEKRMQPLTILGIKDPCIASTIYTSLPPKCRTIDGKFMVLPGIPSHILATPPGEVEK